MHTLQYAVVAVFGTVAEGREHHFEQTGKERLSRAVRCPTCRSAHVKNNNMYPLQAMHMNWNAMELWYLSCCFQACRKQLIVLVR
jgi:hypothetical protein